MTIITLGTAGDVLAKESYETIKKRLYDVNQFIEVTVNDRRVIYNKDIVEGVARHEPKRASRGRGRG